MATAEITSVRRVPSTPRAQQAPNPAELLPVLLKEGWRRKLTLTSIFSGIALLTLAFGLLAMPKNYSASVTILARQSDIIQPLLEGRAVATGVQDRAGMARQVVFSRKVMEDILKTGGWLEQAPSPVERDRLIEQITSRTVITGPREDLVQISYKDNDPTRTFKVTERLGELFIAESLATKERESRDAYEFIDSRVQDYHAKLTGAERALQDYRSQNADAQPGSVTETSSRISSLRGQVEQSRMTLLEQQSRVESLESQMSGESSVTAVVTREGLYRTQILELQSQLDTLLLTYTEQYPDVVRLRHQIADLQRAIEQDQANPRATSGAFADTQFNPHYQELRTQLSEAQRGAAASRSRTGMLENLLDAELDRSRRIAASESVLAELTRDYEVNRDLYQDLLRRRENARVSMELDREERGLTLRVQDPAIMPLRPTGLRLMHVALAGLLLAVAVPAGLLFLLVRFDPRLRSPLLLEQRSAYPILSVIPFYKTTQDRRREWFRAATCASMLVAVVAVYALTLTFKHLSA